LQIRERTDARRPVPSDNSDMGTIRHREVLGMLAALALAAGCGGGTATTATLSVASSVPATQPSTSTPTTTAPAPSATHDLAAYFRAAARMDGRLRAAAVLINRDIGSGTADFGPDTVAAVKAADPTSAGRLIPAGLTGGLLHTVILVQSDLASRWYAFRPVVEPPTGVPSQDRERLHDCLANGAPAAARFASDLAAARRIAAASPPARRVAPASHAAAKVPLQLALVAIANGGCESCGGHLALTMPRIRWHRHVAAEGLPPFDGTIGRIFFYAHYAGGTGWHVRLNAC
jgi:hypothetical protein